MSFSFCGEKWPCRRLESIFPATLTQTSVASVLIQSTVTIRQSPPFVRDKKFLSNPNTEVDYPSKRWRWSILMSCAEQHFLDPLVIPCTPRSMCSASCGWRGACVLGNPLSEICSTPFLSKGGKLRLQKKKGRTKQFHLSFQKSFIRAVSSCTVSSSTSILE